MVHRSGHFCFLLLVSACSSWDRISPEEGDNLPLRVSKWAISEALIRFKVSFLSHLDLELNLLNALQRAMGHGLGGETLLEVIYRPDGKVVGAVEHHHP